MSSIGSSFSPFQLASPSFLERLDLLEGQADGGFTEARRVARDDVLALESALNEQASATDDASERAASPDVLAFVADQFQNENSDTAVAFLLDLAAREINLQNDLSFDDRLDALGTGDLNETRALSQVLQFAVETNRLLQTSNAPIGLRLEILGDVQNGLRDSRA